MNELCEKRLADGPASLATSKKSHHTKNLHSPAKYPSTLCTVRNVATPSSAIPASVHVASYPRSTIHAVFAPNNSTRLAICELVLYLPNVFTAAAAWASGPSAAAHSLKALIVISLAIITHATVGNNHVLPANHPAGTGTVPMRIRIVATINLSATGSKKAPNGVLHSHFRARYPSKKSVTDAPTNSAKHAAHWPENQAVTSSGMATTRRRVRTVGMVHMVVELAARTEGEDDIDPVEGLAATGLVVLIFFIFLMLLTLVSFERTNRVR